MPDLTNKVVTHMTLYADDSSHNTPAYVYAKQFDAKSRFLVIKIMTADGQITAWGSARLNVTRPDGELFYISGTKNEDGTVLVELSQSILAAVGKVSCDLMLYEGEESEQDIITTSTFFIIVDKSNYSGDATEGSGSVVVTVRGDPTGRHIPIVLLTLDQDKELTPEEITAPILYLVYEDEDTITPGSSGFYPSANGEPF